MRVFEPRENTKEPEYRMITTVNAQITKFTYLFLGLIIGYLVSTLIQRGSV